MTDWREREALFRYATIRECADAALTATERGALVRALVGRPVKGPSGEIRSPGRSTLDDWIRAWRRGGFEGLKPKERRVGPVTPTEILDEACALRREEPARTGALIAEILHRRHGAIAPGARTVQRHLARQGLHRAKLEGRLRAHGRFEAAHPNELWTTDVLHGPKIGGKTALLFAAIDDHSRFVTGASFAFAETTLSLEGMLRQAFLSRGIPQILYADNGSPYASDQLLGICARLGIRLVHSAPGRPQGRGKIERFFRSVREGFFVEAKRRELSGLDELERLFRAWLSEVYHRRVHRETKTTPLDRYGGAAPRYPEAEELRQAFLWRSLRVVTKTATVSFEGNLYEVDAVLVGRRVELLYDPFDLARIEVVCEGRPFGLAVAHRMGRHVHKAASREPAAAEPAPPSGIDYLAMVEKRHEAALLRQISYRTIEPDDPGDPDGPLPHTHHEETP